MRSGSTPGWRASSGNGGPCHTSLTSMPRPTSPSCAASMSETTSPASAEPGRGRRQSVAERDRGPQLGELDDAKPVERRDVIVEPPTESLVERFGSVHVGNRYHVDLETQVDRERSSDW